MSRKREKGEDEGKETKQEEVGGGKTGAGRKGYMIIEGTRDTGKIKNRRKTE